MTMNTYKLRHGKNLRFTHYVKAKNKIQVLDILQKNKFPTKHLEDLKIKEISEDSWEYFEDKIKIYFK